MGAVSHAHAVIDFDGVSREPNDGLVRDVVDERETDHDGPILESRRQDWGVRQVVPCPSRWEDGMVAYFLSPCAVFKRSNHSDGLRKSHIWGRYAGGVRCGVQTGEGGV